MTPPLPLLPDALSGVQRAAIFVIALGVETASKLLPQLNDDEIERVSVEVARLERIPANLVSGVLSQYKSSSATVPEDDVEGGLEAARSMLREGLTEERHGAILPRVEAKTEGTGFDLLESVDAAELAAFLAEEHPQTAAVVLSRLAARKAADTLGKLPTEVRSDVIRRLSLLTDPPASALKALDAALRARFGASASGGGGDGTDGVKRAASILTQAGTTASKPVLEALQADAPELASRIEDLLFDFKDLLHLEARALARILTDVDQGALARALFGCDPALSDRIFENVSERVGNAIREEIEMAGELATEDVEDAQRTVIAVVLGLAESGQISLVPQAAPEPAEEPIAA
ncbi:MAG: FliG C-terminal domain-containing protein [Bacteroidota bacterium]